MKLGDLRIWSGVHLTPSAFLASSAASAVSVSLVQRIIPPRLRSLPFLFHEEALSSGHNSSPPTAAALCSLKSWVSIRSLAVSTLFLNQLLIHFPMPVFSPALFENLGPG